MRILVVNWLDLENPQAGGAEIHLHEIFGRLSSWGHRVELLCSGWKGCAPRARLEGIDVSRVGHRHTFSLHARRAFRRRWSEGTFDVIVEDLNKVPLFTPRWSDVPVVLLVHHLFGLTAFQEANPIMALATWLLERPIPRVFRDVTTVAISESTQDDLVRRGLDRADIQVIPNGIEVDVYRPPEGRTRFDEPTLVFVGRIKRYKRIDLILRALVLLGERDLRPRFLVAGKGNHLEVLRRLTEKLHLTSQVEFLGFVTEERKRDLLQRSWAHVLTSAKEGWGISNLEAAAAGTPTVASDSPGLQESVLDGETGYLVPHGDVVALANRLAELIQNRGEISRMGARGLVFAEGYSWDASARAILSVLHEVRGGR